MATPLLGLYAPADAADPGTWGSSWNAQGSLYLDSLIAGLATISLTGLSTKALSADNARCQTLRFTGTLSVDCTVSPDTNVLWNGVRCIENTTSGNFTLTLQNAAGSVTIPQNRRGLLFVDLTYGPRFMSLSSFTNADVIPANYPMTFQSAAAPSGWTQVTTYNDYAMRIVGGAGGGTGGTVDFSTVFGRTQVGDTALTIAQIPSHNHSVSAQAASSSYTAGGGPVNTPYWAGNITETGYVGGGATHTHTMDNRVKYADFIIAKH